MKSALPVEFTIVKRLLKTFLYLMKIIYIINLIKSLILGVEILARIVVIKVVLVALENISYIIKSRL